MATKKQVMAELDKLGVMYSKSDTKETLELLLASVTMLTEPERFSGRVSVEHLNVRDAPDGEVVGQLGRGLPVWGFKVGDWVELDNGGFVRAEFVQRLKL